MRVTARPDDCGVLRTELEQLQEAVAAELEKTERAKVDADRAHADHIQAQQDLDETRQVLDEIARAERLFRSGAIFSEPCAREQARLEARADAAFAARDPRAAESLFARLVEIDPQDVDHSLALGRARIARRDAPGAIAA